MNQETKGTISAVATAKNTVFKHKPRHYSMKSDVVFSSISNSNSNVLTHVGKDHVQVIVTSKGEEIFRQLWRTA